MNKSTIFISSFNPFISRNILCTDAMGLFRSREDVLIVIFVPDYKSAYFAKQFGGPNIVVEGVNLPSASPADIFFTYLASSLVRTGTLWAHKKEKFFRDKKLLRFLVSGLLMKLAGRLGFVKDLVRWLDLRTISGHVFRDYFEKYKPDLVFATDVFNNDDAKLIAGAKFFGAVSVAMVRSWDNITSKGMFRVKPDKLIVHNELIKHEAVKYEGMNPGDIFVSGLPQFDRYIKSPRLAREQFFRRIKLDPQGKLVLFSPFGQRFSSTDWQVLDILKQGRLRGEIPKEVQFLVRPPPNDFVAFLDRFVADEAFFLDRPGHQFSAGVFRDTELDEKDTEWLADSLYHCDLVISAGATLLVDGAVFDKPAILIYLDGWEHRPYSKSVRRFMEYDHGLWLRNSGAIKTVFTKGELFDAVNEYLVHPENDSVKRLSMAKEQCWRLDGQSGRRIYNFISSLL